jgi:hypothetical protein
MDLGDEARVGPVGPSETQGRESAAGLALSVLLHGIAICLLLVAGVFGTQGSQGGLEIVPVEIETAPQSTSAQAEPPTAALPQPDAAHPSDATADGVARSSEPAAAAPRSRAYKIRKITSRAAANDVPIAILLDPRAPVARRA